MKAIIDTDASQASVGAVLSQIQDGEERPLVYFNRLYSLTETNYCTTRKELLAMVEAVRQFSPYVLVRHFLVRTDHTALRWFQRAPNRVGQLARWLDLLCEFDFDVEYRPVTDTVTRALCRDEAAVHVYSVKQPRKPECLAASASPEGQSNA